MAHRNQVLLVNRRCELNSEDRITFFGNHQGRLLTNPWHVRVAILLFFLAMTRALAVDRPLAVGHVPAAVTRLNMRSTDRLPATNQLDLAIGLPLRNREGLQKLLGEIYDPNSPRYHQYLTPAQFAAQFGPTPEQYEAVKNYARTNRLIIKTTHANRLILDVSGSVEDVEKSFHVHMMVYSHPTEARTFYAPDSEPTIAAELPILDVTGLDNYSAPQPMMRTVRQLDKGENLQPDGTGTGPYGTFIGNDFRAAYVSDVSLTGSGQSVALVEFDGYYPKDIASYATNANRPVVPVQKVLVDGFKGAPGRANGEVALDIDMVSSIAPGLSNIILYEGPNNNKQSYNDILSRIASDDLAAQISSSWSAPTGPNTTTDEIFQELAAQGQSFFQSSGDNGAYTGPVAEPSDNPYITIVGGTSVAIGAGQEWEGEDVWNLGSTNGGTGGGISTVYPIPPWQQGIDMSINQGSTTMRNIPDVAMDADNIYLIAYNGKQFEAVGTSASAPLWAGFMALVNEQAASNGLPAIGFANPAIYTLAQGPDYSQDFHDIIGGDNTSTLSPNRFYATSGYDLCTGWGSPVGQNLIDDLTTQRSSLLITPAAGFSAVGLFNGPFNVTNQQFVLVTAGWVPFSWSLINTSLWLNVNVTNGTISPGIPFPISVSLTSAAYDLLPGVYDSTLVFSNGYDGTLQSRSFTLEVDAVGAAQVTISPAAAVSAGAQWQIDGGAWQISGSSISGIEVGSHTLSFSDVSGWTTPTNQAISIQTNETTTVIANYSQEGSLQVTISPSGADLAGAQWQVDGGEWYDSGSNVYLVPGQHSLAFSTVPGWSPPANETVTVQAGATSSINATYLPAGSLQVTLNPWFVSWRLDGGPWQFGSTTLGNIPVGVHTVSFSGYYGYSTPAPVTVSISQYQTNSLVENYLPATGSLKVVIYMSPTGLVANAQWSVDGGPWQTNGATVSGLTAWQAGYQHTLTFAASDGLELGTETVAVSADQTNLVTTVIPEPHAFSIIAGHRNESGSDDGTNDSARFSAPSGVAMDGQGDLFVADAGNSTIRKLTPMGTNWVVTTIAGQPGISGSSNGTNNQATFNSPTGIAAGPDGELYVSDSGNSMIRELIPSGTNWIVSTIAGLAGNGGTNDGAGGVAQFNNPAGLAAGADGSVYVADRNNFTIRKLTQAAGVWTVTTIAGQPGVGDAQDGVGGQARFLYPAAITVNASGTLFVADGGAATIRKLTPQGTNYLVTTIAGQLFAEAETDGVGTNGLFYNPQGIVVDSSNNLYVGDGGAIRMLTPLGTNWLVSTISVGAFNSPIGIVADTNGNIFFASSADDVIAEGWNVAAGDLQVTIAPVEASNLGAQWQVDGGSWRTNGETVIGLTAGAHVVTFSNVADFNAPAPQTVVVTPNQTATAEGDYTPVGGALQVSLGPPEAVTNGAQWRVDGGSWETNGQTVIGLLAGAHVVTFSDVAGLSTPASQTVTVVSNQITTAEGDYTTVQGVLQVSLGPPDAVTIGALWQVDNGPWQTNGATVSNLPYGHHVVSFLAVSNWATPPDRDVMITDDQTNEITGNYSMVWDLIVTIEPSGAVQAGAMWAVDDGPWQTNGATVTGTGWFGYHDVTFLSVDGWSTPAYQFIALAAGNTTTLTGTYQQEGSLQVTMPAGAADAGALWEADSGPWLTNGATVVLVAGNHSLYFSGVGGWVQPTNGTVYVPPAQLTNVIANYLPIYGAVHVNLLPKAAAAAGAQWQVDSGPWQKSGATFSVLPGNHSVNFKNITNWQTPGNLMVNVSYSATNLLAATYNLIESVPPTITILTPSTNRSWAFPALTIVGTAAAHANVSVESVFYRLNNGDWQMARGTTNWAATVLLPSGSNTISAFAVDVNGNRSKTNSITAPYLPASRLTIGIVGSGTVSPNLSGELLTLGQSYTVTASPAKGSVFSNWTGDVNYDLPNLTFVMQSNMFLQANFVPSPFKSFAGKYTGLALETNGAPGTNSGQFSASLTSNGTFTAQLRSSTQKLSFAGQFTALGLWSNTVAQSHAAPLAESLQIDMTGSGTMTGQVDGGISNQYVLAKLSSFSANNPAPQAGKYTLLFSDNNQATNWGTGAVSVDRAGNVHFIGEWADGSRMTQSGTISDFGEWPFYSSLHSTDYLAGWILFTNAPNTNLVGQVFWFRPGESSTLIPTVSPVDVIGSASTNELHPPPQH